MVGIVVVRSSPMATMASRTEQNRGREGVVERERREGGRSQRPCRRRQGGEQRSVGEGVGRAWAAMGANKARRGHGQGQGMGDDRTMCLSWTHFFGIFQLYL